VLEINTVNFNITDAKTSDGSDDGGQKTQMISVQVSVNETDASVYEWSLSDELTAYDVPTGMQGAPYMLAAPTGLAMVSNTSTALTGADGIVTPRMQVSWTDSLDSRVIAVQGQYRLHGAAAWIDCGYVAVGVQQAYIPVVSGQAYDVQVRAVRPNGATSSWTQVTNFSTTSGIVSSISAAQITGNLPATSVSGLASVATTGVLPAASVTGLSSVATAGLPAALVALNANASTGVTASVGAAAQVGTGATITVSGNGLTGTINLTTGTGTLAAGIICQVTWASTLGAAPNGVVAANGQAIGGLGWNATATYLQIACETALAPATAYELGYSFA
jgi:hypothetical protein